MYITSLPVIRETYDDCCSTSAILRSYDMRVDKRDLFLQAAFKEDLRAALGDGVPLLPQVFVDGQHLGSVNDVLCLLESGKLAAALHDSMSLPSIRRAPSTQY